MDIIALTKPITIDGKEIKKIELKMEELTGEDILKIDLEIRAEGNPDGLNSVLNQNALIKIASRATGLLPDDLKRLSAVDFLDLTFGVRNFLLRL